MAPAQFGGARDSPTIELINLATRLAAELRVFALVSVSVFMPSARVVLVTANWESIAQGAGLVCERAAGRLIEWAAQFGPATRPSVCVSAMFGVAIAGSRFVI